jgi:predicted metalloendopeptidase
MFLLRQKSKSGKDDTLFYYQNRINNLTWMSAETKVKAVEKLRSTSK